MDREKFKEELAKDCLMNADLFNEVQQHLFEQGEEANIVIAIEELSELQKELTKISRSVSKDKFGLIEEMADVLIMLASLQLGYNIEDRVLAKAIYIKLKEYQRKRIHMKED